MTLYEVRVYHRDTGHDCGRLWADDNGPMQGERADMEREAREFVARFPEYNYELIAVD